MPENPLFKEFKKAIRNNVIEADQSAMIVEIIEEIINIRTVSDSLVSMFETLKKQVDTLNSRAEKLENYIKESIPERVAQLDKYLEVLPEKIATFDKYFESYPERMAYAEKYIANLLERVSALDGNK